MATVESKPLPAPRRRRALRIGIVLALGLVVTLVWFWRPLTGYAITGASVGARVACSCRYVEGRSLGDCRKDFEPGMQLITLSDDPKARRVTAHFPLLSSQTATFREGEGCLLEPWDN